MVQKLVQTGNSYLYRRCNTYYFRVSIPEHLHALCPDLPREIKRSLRTDSLTDALAMLSDKIPLIRLLRNCTDAEMVKSIYQRLSDFSKQIASWVNLKLSSYNLKDDHIRQSSVSESKKNKIMHLDKAWLDFSIWKSWTDKQTKANQRVYDNLRFFLGNKDIHQINKRQIKSALVGISKLPQRNKKNYKQIPLERLLQVKIPPEDRVSSKYVKEHLKLAHSLFKGYLKDEAELIQFPPTEGVKWDCVSNRYGSFTDSEINLTMEKAKLKPEWFRWFLLLAIHSGARRSEIAKLTNEDIKICPDTNRHYFVIHNGKTKAARRAVPIHDRVIEAGFLQWASDIEGYLFDTANRNLNRVTDLFGSLLDRKVNDYGERLVFHSLRHTFITKARAAGVTDVLVQQVVGHEKSGAGQTDRYTHTFQLKDILVVVDSVGY